MTDRERILTHILHKAESTMQLARPYGSDRERYKMIGSGSTLAHFAHYDKPVPGDLVMVWGDLYTNRFTFSYYVEPIEGSESNHPGAVLRAIGSEELCNYTNVRLLPLRGVEPEFLFDMWRFRVYVKIQAAFAIANRHLDLDNRRMWGCEFGEKVAKIKVGHKYGGFKRGMTIVPFVLEIPFDDGDTHSTLLRKMLRAGLLTREFEFVPDPEAKPEPTQTTIIKTL